MISHLCSILIFLGALLGSGALLSEVHPFAMVPQLREKAAWLAGHADEYDTLFFGSSRIYHGIKPSVFDELTASAGVPTHSFNLGVDGLRPPEDAYVLERVLTLRPKRLRWIIIETGEIPKNVVRRVTDDVRSLHWHDTERTVLMLKALLEPEDGNLRWKKALFGSTEERASLDRAAGHIRLWLLRTLNAGRGAYIVHSKLGGGPTPRSDIALGKVGDGFIPDERPTPADERADYLGDLARPAHVSQLDREAQRNLDEVLRSVGKTGARPILVMTPLLDKYLAHPRRDSPVPFFDYGDAQRWPSLFQIDHRVDHSHLNAAGADLFTRAIASDFIELALSKSR